MKSQSRIHCPKLVHKLELTGDEQAIEGLTVDLLRFITFISNRSDIYGSFIRE